VDVPLPFCRGSVILAANIRNIDAGREQLQVHVLQCVGDYLGDRQVAEPLVI